MTREELEEKVTLALNELVEDSSLLVTRWSAVVETTDATGKRKLHREGLASMTEWDAAGFLFYALHGEGWEDTE